MGFNDQLKASLTDWRVVIWIIWLLFAVYAVLIGPLILPEDQGKSTLIIIAIFTGDLNAVDPSIFMVFNLLGILPIMYALVVLFDDQDIVAWPFVVLSFFTGAFGIFPYVALRYYNQDTTIENRSGLIKSLDRRYNAIILSIITVFLIIYGFFFGSFSTYYSAWQTVSLVHVMTLDFIILTLVFPVLINDDIKRRNMDSTQRLFYFIPIVGYLYYFLKRKKLN